MKNETRVSVGLDVHKDSVMIAVLPEGAAAPTLVKRLSHDPRGLRRLLDRLACGRPQLEGAAPASQGLQAAGASSETTRSPIPEEQPNNDTDPALARLSRLLPITVALAGLHAGGLQAAGFPAATSVGQAPSATREYPAVPALSPPAIDGVLDDAAWREAPWTEPFVDIRGDGWPEPHFGTRVRIVWDDRFLYVGAELEEPHLWATLADRDAILYRENDFEVFLDPDADGLAYYELEINALGTEFDLFLDKPYRRKGSADIAWDMEGLRTAVHLDGRLNDPSDEDVGWSVEIAIPWSALRPPGAPAEAAVGPPRPGDAWRVNFSRVQWPLRVVDGEYRRLREPVDWSDHPEHNWVWSAQGEIDMHIPERWGVVRFVADREGSP